MQKRMIVFPPNDVSSKIFAKYEILGPTCILKPPRLTSNSHLVVVWIEMTDVRVVTEMSKTIIFYHWSLFLIYKKRAGSKRRCQLRKYQAPGVQMSGSRYQVRRFQVPGANFKIPEISKISNLPELILNNPSTNINVGNLQYPSLQISIFGFQTMLLEKPSYSVNHGGPNVFAN